MPPPPEARALGGEVRYAVRGRRGRPALGSPAAGARSRGPRGARGGGRSRGDRRGGGDQRRRGRARDGRGRCGSRRGHRRRWWRTARDGRGRVAGTGAVPPEEDALGAAAGAGSCAATAPAGVAGSGAVAGVGGVCATGVGGVGGVAVCCGVGGVVGVAGVGGVGGVCTTAASGGRRRGVAGTAMPPVAVFVCVTGPVTAPGLSITTWTFTFTGPVCAAAAGTRGRTPCVPGRDDDLHRYRLRRAEVCARGWSGGADRCRPNQHPCTEADHRPVHATGTRAVIHTWACIAVISRRMQTVSLAWRGRSGVASPA